jgi:hypothetical protein
MINQERFKIMKKIFRAAAIAIASVSVPATASANDISPENKRILENIPVWGGDVLLANDSANPIRISGKAGQTAFDLLQEGIPHIQNFCEILGNTPMAENHGILLNSKENGLPIGMINVSCDFDELKYKPEVKITGGINFHQ